MNAPVRTATRARELVTALGLAQHPEGGWYRELHRSALAVAPQDARPLRAALTTIYFLLERGQHSRWHRVGSDEVWHHYEGGPLELLLATPACERVERHTLGPLPGTLPGTLAGAARPVLVVPAGWWQAARPLGDYALVGCSVAPGFEFADFAFLRDEPAPRARLAAAAPDTDSLV